MTKLSLLILAFFLSACASITGSDFLARKRDGNLTSIERYHENILSQLGDAWNERGLESMNALLDKNRAGAAPEQIWRYEQFEAMYQDAWVHIVGFESMGFYVSRKETSKETSKETPKETQGGAATGQAAVRVVDKDFTMGERNRVVLRIVPIEGHSGKIKALGPDGQRSTVFLELQIMDVLADGSRTQGTSPMKLELDKDIVFSSEKPFELEIPLIQEPDPAVYIRLVRLRGDLFPAELVYDDVSMKTGRFVLQELKFARYPTGFEKIKAQPLKTLENALTSPARYRGHIILCAHFIHRDRSKKDVEKAIDLLLAGLPSVPPLAEPTLLYSLRILVPEGGPPSRDRDGWLHWSNDR